MSDVQNTTPAPAAEATEPVAAAPATTEPQGEAAAVATTAESDAPAAAEAKPEVTDSAAEPSAVAPAAAEEKKDEAAQAALPEKKAVEPITEGLLAYKGPGLVKSLIPSKKNFWLSDSAVTPQNMHLYMRGEKPEISNAVVAWASQTGKGLLFFNKKDDTDKTKPQSVLALYDATELKKASPHEITFELGGHKHTLKATSDAERDGWYMSLESAIEAGKAEKETIRASEGYKAEMEKLNKPHTVRTTAAGAVAGAGAAAGVTAAKKSTDGDKTETTRAGSDADDAQKKQKSRSTSRGMLDRLKGKKEEVETKKADKEETKPEESDKADEAVPAAAAVVAAPAEDKPAAETTPVTETKTEEKTAKPAKRVSIFGRMSSGFIKSPGKEKDQKDAELKPEVPPKDTAVSETAPQIPEPTTDVTEAAAVPAAESTEAAAETKPAEPAKEQTEATSPKDHKGFLSGFLNKRNRSVSPSANMKEAPKKEEVKKEEQKPEEEAAPVTDDTAEPSTEAAKPNEVPVAETSDKPSEPKADEKKAEDHRRTSVFSGIGRRASKAFKNFQSPTKKEDVAPATTAKKEETGESKPAEDKPVVNGEAAKAPESEPTQNPTIGDVVPDAVNVGQPQTTPVVTASA